MARRILYKTFVTTRGGNTAPNFDKVPCITVHCEHSYRDFVAWGLMVRLLKRLYEPVMNRGVSVGDEVEIQIDDGRLPRNINPQRVIRYRIFDYSDEPLTVFYAPRNYRIPLVTVELHNADIVASMQAVVDEKQKVKKVLI